MKRKNVAEVNTEVLHEVLNLDVYIEDLRTALAKARQYKHEDLELVFILRPLAGFLFELERYTKAREYFRELVKIAIANQGKAGCPSVVESRWSLAQCHFHAASNEQALFQIDEIWKRLESQQLQNCDLGLRAMILGAKAQEALEEFEAALSYLDRADLICAALKSTEHMEITHTRRAALLEMLNRDADAIAVREKLLALMERKCGDKGLLGHSSNLVLLYRKTGQEDKASALEERARAVRTKTKR
jgi:tetratricopeptide (TPR) repeat protein